MIECFERLKLLVEIDVVIWFNLAKLPFIYLYVCIEASNFAQLP